MCREKKAIFLMLFLVSAFAFPSKVQAFWKSEESHPALQSESGYDVNTVITVRGKIRAILMGADRKDVQLEMDINGSQMLALLGPSRYWGEQGAAVNVGDWVTVRGSKAQGHDGMIVILVREIELSHGLAVELRDESGFPRWKAQDTADGREGGGGGVGRGRGSGHGGGGGAGGGGGGGGH